MRVTTTEITLEELQVALRAYMVDLVHVADEPNVPDTVVIVSHDKRITVELQAGGFVEADAFRHRA